MKKTTFLVFAIAAFLLGEVIAAIWYLRKGPQTNSSQSGIQSIRKETPATGMVYYIIEGRVTSPAKKVGENIEARLSSFLLVIDPAQTGLLVHTTNFDDDKDSSLASADVWIADVKKDRLIRILISVGEKGDASPLGDALEQATNGNWNTLSRFRLAPSVVEIVKQ